MVIQRNKYIEALISKRWNGKVKIITGIRRCGKSFLLSTLYKDYLKKEGVSEDCFIEIALDRKANIKYRNPNVLYEYIMDKACDEEKRYYVFIDEIQLSIKVKNTDIDESLVSEDDKDMLYTTFYDILNDLMARKNLDIYVTGSNSKMLSSDIVTNFRDRGSEIKVYPLSFKEYYEVSGLEKADALEEYLTYGGMPSAVLEQSESEKQKYLYDLHKNVYIKDIVERYNLKDDEIVLFLRAQNEFKGTTYVLEALRKLKTNKKIVEKSKIFDYLKDYIDSLKEIKNKSMSIEHLNNIESNKTLNVKPFNDCESKLSSLYCYIDFQ